MSDDSPARLHGGVVAAELEALGLDPAAVVDFSTNVNPYGPHAAVAAAIREAPIARYPDPEARLARRTLAAGLDLAPERIVVGAGAAELLWLAARTLLRPGDAAVVVAPTFSELGVAAARARARVREWRASAADDFRIDLDDVSRAVDATNARLVSLCVPNNPTGAAPAFEAIAALADRHPAATLVLDESYLSLSERYADAARALPAQVLRIRSLTKEHAIPGVRVGYAVAAPELAQRLEAERPAWPVGAAAQAAIVAACRAESFVAEARARILGDREALAARLRAIGLTPLPSLGPFLLFAVPIPATELRLRLLRDHGVLVRDASSFGLPRHVRVGVRNRADVDRLVAALRITLGERAR
jgi:histidinol-phosphate/aromatic aminotransferase/cobyric acid decarboxylase-like protein